MNEFGYMNRSWGRRGTTLLELTVATMVILLIVVFMTSLWIAHARVTGKARYRMTAALVAELKMEEWVAKGWTVAAKDALDASLADGEVQVSTQMGSAQENIIPYVYHVAAVDDPDPLRAPLVGVLQVTVKFPDERSNSPSKEIRYETYVAKPTP